MSDTNSNYTPSGLPVYDGSCLEEVKKLRHRMDAGLNYLQADQMKDLFSLSDVQKRLVQDMHSKLNSYLEFIIQTFTKIRKPYTREKFTRHKIRLVQQNGPPMSFTTEYWVERKGVKLGQSFTIQLSFPWLNQEK